jgi:hypothetical protein
VALVLCVALTALVFNARDAGSDPVEPVTSLYRYYIGHEVSHVSCEPSSGASPATCTYMVDGWRCSASFIVDHGLKVDRCRPQ